MSGYYLAVAVLALLNVASIGLSLLIWLRLQRLEAQVAARPAAEGAPPAPSSAPSSSGEKADRFSAALMGGEMSLKLAQELREPPEKYRFVASLAEQGMEAAEIARALHLSQGEVDQLLTLSRLGRRDVPADEAKDSAETSRKV